MNIQPSFNIPYNVYEKEQEKDFWVKGGLLFGGGLAGLTGGAALLNPISRMKFSRAQRNFADNANAWKRLRDLHTGALRLEDIPTTAEREMLRQRYEQVKHLFDSRDFVNELNSNLNVRYSNHPLFETEDEKDLMKFLIHNNVLKNKHATEYRNAQELNNIFAQIEKNERNSPTFQSTSIGEMVRNPIGLLQQPAVLSGTMLGGAAGKILGDELRKKRMQALVEQYNQQLEGSESALNKDAFERYDRFWSNETYEGLSKEARRVVRGVKVNQGKPSTKPTKDATENTPSAKVDETTNVTTDAGAPAKKKKSWMGPVTLGMAGLTIGGTAVGASKALGGEANMSPTNTYSQPLSASQQVSQMRQQTAQTKVSSFEKKASSIYSKSMLQ